MKEYAIYSYWLETAEDDLTPRPPLDKTESVDVAILGAGYTGLWTAYYLLERHPELRVAIVEKEIAGFGASGRNGGWCTSGFPLGPKRLIELFGPQVARRLLVTMADAVNEIERVSMVEKMDIQFHPGGVLRIARGQQEVPTIRKLQEDYALLGLGDRYSLLNAQETAKHVEVNRAQGALFCGEGAAFHPGRLVRGLARLVEQKGATIYEQSDVVGVAEDKERGLRTVRGRLFADAVVLAGEAYLTRFPRFHRRFLPVYSLIRLTEPLSQSQWARIGWQQRELIASNRYTVDYLQRTADGRILFGSRGAPYHFGSRIKDRYDLHPSTERMIERQLWDWFPALKGVRITHSWGGPVGMPRDWMPTVMWDAKKRMGLAGGYTGQGVAASNLAGRIITDLINETDSEITRLPMINHQSPLWEPEPLRWLGARYVQMAYARIDSESMKSGRPPGGRTMAERLGKH